MYYYPKLNPVISQYIVVIIANLCILCAGSGLSWSSPVLVKLMNTEDVVLDRPVTEEEGSWIAAIPLLSSMLAMFFGIIIDVIGRKYCMVLGNLFNLVAGLTYLFSTHVWMVMLGRAFCGVASALLLMSVPAYSAEISSKEIRGALCTIFQISYCLGTMIMFSIGPFLSFYMINVVYVVTVTVSSAMIMFLPETPYFLYSKGHVEETLQVLKFLRGCELSAENEMEEYRITCEQYKIKTNISKKIFKNKLFLKALATFVFLCIATQCTCYSCLSFYLQTVLESTKTNVKSEIASAILGIINISAALGTAFTTDRFGRKPILATAYFGVGLGMIGMGTFFKLRENIDVTGFLNYLPLLSLILTTYSFSAGPGSLLYTVGAELFDGETRSIGTSISYFLTAVILFPIMKYFSYMIHVLGAACSYWTFGFNSFLCATFVIFFLSETKGKSIS